MGFDVYSLINVAGFLFDLCRNCTWNRRITGVVLPEKCGKSTLCNSLTSQRVSLIDLDEIIKSSSENADKLTRLKHKGEYSTITLLILKEAVELLDQIKQVHKYKRLVLISSNTELLDALHIPKKCYVPSNTMSLEIASKLGEMKPVFENSRQTMIQNRADVFNSYNELSSQIADRFHLSNKL